MIIKNVKISEISNLETNATMDILCPELVDFVDKQPKRKGIVILPGGAYRFRSNRETFPVAFKFCNLGYNVFIVNYTTCDFGKEGFFPTPHLEVMSCFKYFREHHEELNLDKDHLFLLGFSAGGHLAGSYPFVSKEKQLRDKLGIKDDEDIYPNGLILSYPVTTLEKELTHEETSLCITGGDEKLIKSLSIHNRIDETYPPTFAWHTITDAAVPYQNSVMVIDKLNEYKIKNELLLFKTGYHGLSTCDEIINLDANKRMLKTNSKWIEKAHKFIDSL